MEKNPQLQKLLEKLEKEKKEIECQLSEFTQKGSIPGDYNARFPEHEPDQESVARAIQEMDQRKALEHELEERLMIVNKTIGKIKNDTYGICENCSVKINPKRLEAATTAFFCVSCVSKMEGNK